MTDTTQFIQNQQAITSDLNYGLKPSAVRSKSYRSSILPTNKSSFGPTETAIIYIPGGRRGTYLDCNQSYLRFTIKNNDTVAFRVDNNASSVINRLDIFHGSNLLETIQNYNLVANYIFDMQSSISQRAGLSNIYGFDAGGDRSGFSIPVGTQQTFCMPIISGVCGILCDKMLPLGLLNDDIRLEFTFETLVLMVVPTGAFTTAVATAPSAQIIDFQLELTIVELSDEGESLVRSNYAYPEQPLYLHGSSWRHYISALPANQAGGFSTLVPARFASLKQICLQPRRSTEITSQLSYGLGSRANPNFSYYWWRIGSSIIPSKAVYLENTSNTGGYGEAYAELLKAWHDLHSISNSTCLGAEYNVGDSTPANSNVLPITAAANLGGNSFKNGFVIAQELESFAQRNDMLLSGMNTLNSQIFFETTITTAPTSAYTLDFFAWYDHILILDRGMLSVKF